MFEWIIFNKVIYTLENRVYLGQELRFNLHSTKKEYRIAIVDDEGDLLTLFTEALKTAGLNVIGYTDPIQILDVFESNPNSYDMLITDIRMPNMNGFQLVKRILELNKRIKILIISAFDNLEFEKEYNSKYKLLRKPISVENLVNTVKMLVDT